MTDVNITVRLYSKLLHFQQLQMHYCGQRLATTTNAAETSRHN